MIVLARHRRRRASSTAVFFPWQHYLPRFNGYDLSS